MSNNTLKTFRPKLRTNEAAHYCGSTRSTFEKMRLVGNGPTYMVIGSRTVVYDPDDLDAWLDAKRRRSTSVAA